MRLWFFSDLHIQNDEEDTARGFVQRLHEIRDQVKVAASTASRNSTFVAQNKLLLLGDIFDLWVGAHAVFVRRYQKVIAAIRGLRELGVEVIYVEGNHDLHIEGFWEREIGAKVLVEALYISCPGLIVRVEHGDLINQADLAYLRYRRFVRHPILSFLGRRLPGAFWGWLGGRASRTSRKYSRPYREGHQEEMIALTRAHAQREFLNRPFDLIVTGHTHVRDDWTWRTADGRRVRSVNLGSAVKSQEGKVHIPCFYAKRSELGNWTFGFEP